MSYRALTVSNQIVECVVKVSVSKCLSRVLLWRVLPEMKKGKL